MPPSKKPAGQADARVEPVQGPADQSGEQICLVPEKEESDSEYLGKGQALTEMNGTDDSGLILHKMQYPQL